MTSNKEVGRKLLNTKSLNHPIILMISKGSTILELSQETLLTGSGANKVNLCLNIP